jgi:hypothetical protein
VARGSGLEVVDHFGAVSYETQKVEGHWRHGGVIYRDNLVKDCRRRFRLDQKSPVDERIQSSLENPARTA